MNNNYLNSFFFRYSAPLIFPKNSNDVNVTITENLDKTGISGLI